MLQPKDASLKTRFNHLVLFCTKSECIPHEKNQLEQIGDLGLYPLEWAPKKIWNNIGDPRWIAILVWFLVEVAVSVLFYPTETVDWLSYMYAFIPEIPWWLVRFTAYLFTLEIILAFFLRAEGRLFNKQLMNIYYGKTDLESV